MKRRRRNRTASSRIKFWALISLLVMSGAACGDIIELRSAVRLEADDTVVNLGDIAELKGEHAEALADAVIARLEESRSVLELPVRNVRDVLDRLGVHWGRIQLNGRHVVVRPGRVPGASMLMAMQGATIAGANDEPAPRGKTDPQTAETLAQQPTLRGAIASFLAAGLRRSSADVRIVFDRDDDEALDTPRNMYSIEFEPTGSLISDRLGLNIRLWEGTDIVKRHNITIGLLLRTNVAVPAHEIEHNTRLDSADIRSETRWLKPSEAALAVAPAAAVGRIAARRLKEGEPIARRSVERETLIRRGDLVTVRCLVGGAVIALQAEAREDGSEGDTIEFRKRGERISFLASVAGPGEAVVDLSQH